MSEVSNYFIFRRNKENKLSNTAAKEKKLDIYFSVGFGYYYQNVTSGRKSGHYVFHPIFRSS